MSDFYAIAYQQRLESAAAAENDAGLQTRMRSEIEPLLRLQPGAGGDHYFSDACLADHFDVPVVSMRAAVAHIALARLNKLAVRGERTFRLHPGGIYYGRPDDLFHAMSPDAFQLEALAATGTDAAFTELDAALACVDMPWPEAAPTSLERPRFRNGATLSAESVATYLVHLLSKEECRFHDSRRARRRPVAGAAALIERALDPDSLLPLMTWLMHAKLPRSLRRRMPSGSVAVADLVGEAVRDKRLTRAAYEALPASTLSYDRLYAREAFEHRWLWRSMLMGERYPWLEGRWPTAGDAIASAREWHARAAGHLEDAMRRGKTWTLNQFRPLLAHPVTREQIPGLVFTTDEPWSQSSTRGFVFDTEGRPTPAPKARFRVCHPAERREDWPTPLAPYPFAEMAPAPEAKPDLRALEPIARRLFIKRCRELDMFWSPADDNNKAHGFYAGSCSISFLMDEPERGKLAFDRIELTPHDSWTMSPLVRAETWRLARALAGGEVSEVAEEPHGSGGTSSEPAPEGLLFPAMKRVTGLLGRCTRCRGIIRRADAAYGYGDELWHERCAKRGAN